MTRARCKMRSLYRRVDISKGIEAFLAAGRKGCIKCLVKKRYGVVVCQMIARGDRSNGRIGSGQKGAEFRQQQIFLVN